MPAHPDSDRIEAEIAVHLTEAALARHEPRTMPRYRRRLGKISARLYRSTRAARFRKDPRRRNLLLPDRFQFRGVRDFCPRFRAFDGSRLQ